MTPKDMLTNPHFCPMPWAGVMYNHDGTVKNCIRSSEPIGNIRDHDINTLLTTGSNFERQQNIIQQHPVTSCQPCRDLESGTRGFNIISDRVFYIRELKKINPAVYTAGNHELHTVDIRWSNLCNFACVYCSPEFSSRWASELDLWPARPSDTQQQQFSDWVLSQAHQLRHVYLAGGEPLLMRENLELLSRLPREVNIRINTNLSRVNTEVFEKICEFPNVHWTVSVESMQEEFEYIRWGGNWQDFITNLDTISSLGHKITFNMLHFALNAMSIFDCVDWLRLRGFHANSFVIGALLEPDYLNIRHLPHSVLDCVVNELQRRIQDNPGFLLENSYQNLLKYIQTPVNKDFNNSLAQLQTLDQRRGCNSKITFPHLYNHGN
jgi:MoaA/NifB/PqqE/SkfB family radical SAM enzyme